jgi:hypothetical protein
MPKMLGCYTAALNKKQTPPWTSLPIPAMQQQCETALRLLREGRIDGIIIYGCTTMDLNWKSVDWTREWIQRAGNTSCNRECRSYRSKVQSIMMVTSFSREPTMSKKALRRKESEYKPSSRIRNGKFE